jgi:hypothetical protein
MFRLLAIAAALAALPIASAAAQDCPARPENDTIDFGGQEPLEVVTADARHAFSVEIADTGDERSRGLMFRPEIAPDFGMLFEYPEPEPVSFYMRNTCASLDIIYVRPDGRIESIVRHAVPFSERSLPSIGAVTGVLEIAGGRAEELEIEPGDLVVHPFFGNVADAAEGGEDEAQPEQPTDGE